MTTNGPGTRAYHGAVRLLSAVFIALGAVLLGITISAGGGPLSIGVLMGLAFVAVGAGRLWMSARASGPGR